MKFEEAFCRRSNTLITIDEVAKIMKEQPVEYIEQIKGQLFCPECNKPRLSFNNAINPYFSTYPLEQHSIACTLRQAEMTPREVETFVEMKSSIQTIQRQAESLLALLLSDRTNVGRIKVKETQGRKLFAELELSGRNDTAKRIPRKRIDTAFSSDDYDCYKLFYGSVWLQWEIDERSAKKQYKILLRARNNRKLLCKLFVSADVYRYIDMRYKTPAEYACQVVFLAKIKCSEKKRAYQTAILKYGQWICLEKG